MAIRKTEAYKYLGTTSQRGRPRQKFGDNIEEDIQESGISKWREKIRSEKE